ncbi:Endolytic murein transglycosylase [Pseudodesulfovibrio profundus]|uniref:Endolytic murein transglycosylase n=1 Tax=Pseudodesulfovibrio profundus TaxID=57320 RepID=A0A2C8FBT4_9BACT|nr:endolytic transglycosylase MltG [Pseudodesulfovibrio profundus]SOB59897.1 Endolytic murein transglycosylase [Pseudodesulfovibrio profundus]
MARKRTLIIAFTSLLLMAALGSGGYFYFKAWQQEQFLTVPPETPGRDVIFRVEPGQIFTTIARNLKEAGLITDTLRFRSLAMEQGKSSSIRAGKFKLNTGWVPGEILHELTTSAGIMKRVSVREGLTWWQTGIKVEEAGIGSRESFASAVADRELLDRYGIQADTAEGYLFPETYLLTPPQGDQSVYMAETMIKEFFNNARKAWPDGLPEWEELHKTVILASIVEKETGDVTERARIAGVFQNRLKRGMLIQSDPTIIYGLGEAFDGDLRRVHLKDKSNPYNTYTRRGLPPGPICSPGLDAIKAVLEPESHSYLYFVAKGDGSHYFSKSLKEHNRAVRKYQLRRNKKTYRSTKQ